jgi:hypothetical protein
LEPELATELFKSRWSEEIRLIERLENDIYAENLTKRKKKEILAAQYYSEMFGSYG